MGLSADLLSKWGKFTEAQIAEAGPNVLKYYQTHVKPELEKKAEPAPQIIEKLAKVRRSSNHLNREDYAPNRLRTKCSFIGFRVRNGEGEELRKLAAEQNISLSEMLRQRTMAKSGLDSKYDVPSRSLMEYDPAPRRCMVRFRVSPKEMLFYQQEIEKRGFASMADFFREAVRRMVYSI
jgi:hypothetical protein